MGRKSKDELAAEILELERRMGLDATATAGMNWDDLNARALELRAMPGAMAPVETETATDPPQDPGDGAKAAETAGEEAEEGAPALAVLDPQFDPENPLGHEHILFLDLYHCMDYSVRMGQVRAAESLGKWVDDILAVKAGCWVDVKDPKPPAGYTVREDPKRLAEKRRKDAEGKPVGSGR